MMLTLFAKLGGRRGATRIGYFRQLLEDAIRAVIRATAIVVRHIHVVIVFDDALH